MKTELGRHFERLFPGVRIQEDDFGDGHYWVAVRVGDDQWISIEVLPGRGFGVCTARDGELDFGGHDQFFKERSEIIAYVADALREKSK